MPAEWIKYSELEEEPTHGEWFYRSGDSYSKGLIPKKDPGVLKLGSEPLEIWSQPIGWEDWEGGRPADLRKKLSVHDLGGVAGKMTGPRFTTSLFAALGRPSLDYQLAKAWASGSGPAFSGSAEITAPECEEGYLFLKPGEYLRNGDEYFLDGKWKPISNLSHSMEIHGKKFENTYRRKIETGKPRISEIVRDYQSGSVISVEVDHALDAMCHAFSGPVRRAHHRADVRPAASLLEEAKQVELDIWQAVDRNEKLLEEEKAGDRDEDEAQWRYVLLKEGELIEEGDEYFSPPAGEWRASSCCGGKVSFSDSITVYRRKISWDPLADQGEEDDRGVEWRELKVGEVVERGDEVKTRDNWRPAPDWIVGYRWDGGMASFRRKIVRDPIEKSDPGLYYELIKESKRGKGK